MDKKQAKRKSKWYDSPINRNIRELIQQKKINTTDFAHALGISVEAVRQWCTGYSRPDIDKLIYIAKELDVSTDYLLGKTIFKNPGDAERGIHELTSLSDEAIAYLKTFAQPENPIELSVINFLLGSETFSEFVGAFNSRFVQEFNIVYRREADKKQLKKVEAGELEILPDDHVIIGKKTGTRYYKPPFLEVPLDDAKGIYHLTITRLAVQLMEEFIASKDWTISERSDNNGNT